MRVRSRPNSRLQSPEWLSASRNLRRSARGVAPRQSRPKRSRRSSRPSRSGWIAARPVHSSVCGTISLPGRLEMMKVCASDCPKPTSKWSFGASNSSEITLVATWKSRRDITSRTWKPLSGGSKGDVMPSTASAIPTHWPTLRSSRWWCNSPANSSSSSRRRNERIAGKRSRRP